MNEKKDNKKEIFYAVIGIATLIVAVMGATFAYYTATASNENTITGNMATVKLGLAVTKATTAGNTAGLIPMSNTMVEQAVSNASGNGVCVDDNNNAVCQVYKIVLTNTSTAGVFVDGYVSLIKGSGKPVDYTATGNNPTSMRWAQVFVSSDHYTTAGTQDVGGLTTNPTFEEIGADQAKDPSGLNKDNIKTKFADTTTSGGVLKDATISGSTYKVIGTNYIRVSDHNFSAAETLSSEERYTRDADVTSALVFNQSVEGSTDGISGVDKTYYIVVWLSENGKNQTVAAADAAKAPENFFQGQVKFTSAQGSEVSATFSGYTRVESDLA